MSPTVTIAGRSFSVAGPSLRDPRLHVAAVLLTLQAIGQAGLGFRVSIAQILLCLGAGALIEFAVTLLRDRAIAWPASGLLTGNSTALILRVPGTVHGDWWSLRGAWIFLAVVAVSMASKYLLRWRGRHLFNPSNLGLVLAFVALGPVATEPLDLWWAPPSAWLLAAYALLLGGGLWIGRELRLLGLMLGFLAGFAVFTAVALGAAPDHCLFASWHALPVCGGSLWWILVTSPEILLFGLFMVPDPRTVPEGPLARVLFGVLVALLAALLVGPTALEFWTKTAILASLVLACALRFALAALVAPIEAGGGPAAILRRGAGRLAVIAVAALLLVEALPLSAALSTEGLEPAAGRTDGSTLALPAPAGGDGLATWFANRAAQALPPAGGLPEPSPGAARVWIEPDLPVTEDPAVAAFDSSMTPAAARRLADDLALDLEIEAEARRAHDAQLAGEGATGDALDSFTAAFAADPAGRRTEISYSFDGASVDLYLPRFSTQASRLVGVSLHGTVTTAVYDAAGTQLSSESAPYTRVWGLVSGDAGGRSLIATDYTGLARA